MTFPFLTATTAGILLILQMALAFAVSGARGQHQVWVGDGGKEALLRAGRRHGNLAENAAIFVVGFGLLELAKFNAKVVMGLCAAFVLVRLLHAVGLSRRDTGNIFRMVGGVGTYLIGFALGGLLVWVGVSAASMAGLAG